MAAGTVRHFASQGIFTIGAATSMGEMFDPMIARTFILPFRKEADEDGVFFAEDTILINLGEDVDRKLVCVTTILISPSVAGMLFPTTSIGMANMVTMLINSAYSSMTAEEWTSFLAEADALP